MDPHCPKKLQCSGLTANTLYAYIVLCLILLAIASYFSLGWLRTQYHTILNDHAVSAYKSNLIAMYSRQQANTPSDMSIFMGDSLVQGLSTAALNTPFVNYGIGHARLSTVNTLISQLDKLETAQALVFAMGINDVLVGEPEAVGIGYQEIAAKLPANVPIIVHMMLPVDEDVLGREGLNTVINNVNKTLFEKCAEFEAWKCIDLTGHLKDESGELDARYHLGDGLHLNQLGNAIWIDALNARLPALISELEGATF